MKGGSIQKEQASSSRLNSTAILRVRDIKEASLLANANLLVSGRSLALCQVSESGRAIDVVSH